MPSMLELRRPCGVKKSDSSFRNQIGEVLARANGFNCVEEAGQFFSENMAIAFWMDDLPCRPSVAVSHFIPAPSAQGDQVTCHWNFARPLIGRRRIGHSVDETADVRL
jgi:hypothetical protein